MMGGFYWPLRDWNAGQRIRRRGFSGLKNPVEEFDLALPSRVHNITYLYKARTLYSRI